jgi:chromosome partitioning protein
MIYGTGERQVTAVLKYSVVPSYGHAERPCATLSTALTCCTPLLHCCEVLMRLAVAADKGGVGKTTTAVFLAGLLHRQGSTLLVDADPQQSALAWSAGLPFQVVSLPVRDLHRRIPELASGFEHVVIDTPPGDRAIIRSAVMSVPLVVVPVSATGLDINRLAPTWELLQELEVGHPAGLAVAVLLTTVRRGTRSMREARDVLEEVGYPLLDTEVPLAESYAAAFGTMPEDFGAYDAVLGELKS